MRKNIFTHLLRLATVALMLMVVAIQRDGRLLGNDLTATNEATDTAQVRKPQPANEGTMVVSTVASGKDIIGYAGPTPLTVTVKDGIVTDVVAEENNETPGFFDKAFDHLYTKWKGRKAEDILKEEPDALSGATLSCNALNRNMRLALQQVTTGDAENNTTGAWDFVRLLVLVVVALGCVLPLFRQFHKYRTIWLCINVAVLGLWSGTFLSYSQLVNWLSNGTNMLHSLPVMLMIVAAFVYPLFGKKNHYCTWICPMGSLQDLAGKTNRKHKWLLSATTTKRLSQFSEVLWATLMLLMLTGVWFQWMDYELFTAFLFRTAAPAVVGIAVLFIILSAFVPRPYCRFVCPTGCLARMAQTDK